jgi:hypothetical protein
MRVITRTPPSPADRATVAWDVDSTIWDFLAGFYATAQTRHAEHFADDRPDGDLWDHVSSRIGDPAAQALLPEVYSAAVMGRHGALPGAVEATVAARAAGARIVIMTHRPPEAADETARFLDDSGAHWDELRCGFDAKVLACTTEGFGVIIDDRPQTLEEAATAGLETLTIEWTWTREVCARYPQIIQRPDWHTLTPEVLGAIERVASGTTRARLR